MYRISSHVIAFSLGVLALGSIVQAFPPTPSWVDELCADASPCVGPVSKFEGLAIAIQWLMPDPANPGDWIECPPNPGAHPQNTCGPVSDIAYWIVQTNGDVGHGANAVDHRVDVVTDSPIYSAAMPNFPSEMHLLGAVVAFGLPPTAVAPQNPQFPAPDPIDTQAWFAAACAADPSCGAGGISQTEFDALLATSPYLTHVHDLDPATITVGGATVTTGVGR